MRVWQALAAAHGTTAADEAMREWVREMVNHG